MRERIMHAIVTMEVNVSLPVDDPEQPCSDPSGEIPDGEQAEWIIRESIPREKTQIVYFAEGGSTSVRILHVDIRVDKEE